VGNFTSWVISSSSAYPLEVLSKPFDVAKKRPFKGLLKHVGGEQGACAFESSSSSAYPLEVLSKPFDVAKKRPFKGLLKHVGGEQGACAFVLIFFILASTVLFRFFPALLVPSLERSFGWSSNLVFRQSNRPACIWL
jgi:hypothetical protein